MVSISEHRYLDGIRVIFKKHLMQEAIAFCGEIKKLGYKVFAQAVSITSYSDEELLELVNSGNRRLLTYNPITLSRSFAKPLVSQILLSVCPYMQKLSVPPDKPARAGNVIGGGDFANDRIIPDCIQVKNNFRLTLFKYLL